MVAERDRVASIESPSADSVMAHEIRWFFNKVGPEVVGEEVVDQVNNFQFYPAIVLEEVASGKMEIEDRFPTLYNIEPSGIPVILRELGFISSEGSHLRIIVPHNAIGEEGQNTDMSFVHVDKPYSAQIHHLSDDKEGLFNALSIRRYP